MASKKKSINLLPEYFRTEKNSKFLSSTIDQLIQKPELERIDAFAGSNLTPNYNAASDFYIKESFPLRKNYSLSPAAIFKDNKSAINDVVAFDDLINELKNNGASVDNLDRLLRSKFYSFDPYIDWDKLVNFNSYYWLPQGPDSILLDDENLDVENNIIGETEYLMSNGYYLSNGMKIAFENNPLQSSYRNKSFIVEGVGDSIKLIDFEKLKVFEPTTKTYNEKFDSDPFDEFPFDSDRKLPLDPDYITINRSSQDLNPWSRYNRWFHKDILSTTAKIRGDKVILPLTQRAKRPIIEFRPNIQLYNFGNLGITNVDFIDTDTINAFKTVNGSAGYYVDGVLLQSGSTVIFNSDEDLSVRGKVYRVSFSTDEVPILSLTLVLTPDDKNSVGINFGNVYGGTSWFYDAINSKWKYAQQHQKINEPPLFDLFNNLGQSYAVIPETNDFDGSKIFGYDVGTGNPDSVLGFPLVYQNSVGVGSYLFKNYFMTDIITYIENSQSLEIPTSQTYFKINNESEEILKNVWVLAEDYKIPVVETQVATSTTNTFVLKAFDKPIISSDLVVSTFVNNAKVETTVIADSTQISVFLDKEVQENQLVVFKINSQQVPNNNGYYELPLGLTNNPLNSSIDSFTLSELSDHLTSMQNHPDFSPDFSLTMEYTGSNLRDFSNYTKFGTRLILNENPISFSKIFLGKKEHNVVDAIRFASDAYNQFKFNFIRNLNSVGQDTTVSEAVDFVLSEMNKNKDYRSPFYLSDMVPFGQDSIIRKFVVNDISIIEYPLGIDFDLERLSYNAVLIYVNDVQLLHGKDYVFNYANGSVSIESVLNIDDEIKIVIYQNTKGSYIPSTPTKLGLWPKFIPEIYNDDTFIGQTVSMIQCHDGSLVKAFNDYRDNLILELEKRIFNNIKVTYNTGIFDYNTKIPGAFRGNSYSLQEFNNILLKDFSRWSGFNNVNYTDHSVFDEGDPFTWSYKNTQDNELNLQLDGSWRAIYKFFFDTDRPHTHPWEIMGYSIKPDWWDSYYSWTDVLKRQDLISAIEDGKIYQPPSTQVNLKYRRLYFSNVVPVDQFGNLLSPAQFLTSINSWDDRKSNWKFGDIGPAENAWRRSSYFPFAVNIAMLLMHPCDYLSKLYDVSNVSFNPLDQLTYLEDDLYLNPKKVYIDGENEKQIAGYGTYVVERGKQKDQLYVEKLRDDIDYFNFNLFYKLGGFSSKDKLQINIDSIDPVSASPGVVLPPEDYSLILNTSNPINSISISGIIVQKTNGKFRVKGYDVANPYFEILIPIKTVALGTVSVGGKSEDFTEWSGITVNNNPGLSSVELTSAKSATSSRFYKAGQIVRYNNRFYRAKVGHTPGGTFDPKYWQEMPYLPMKGGVTVRSASRFEDRSIKIPYGTEYSTIQEVYDLIIGYGAWLEKQGFIFNENISDLGEISNWKYSGKEFLYWCTQNWADNNLITLSPFANTLQYSFRDSIVDNLISNNYDYSLLKADGKSFPINNFVLDREDGICTIKTQNTEEGIFFATLNSVQKEHALVFNNNTIFNDTIYDIETGYRQQRVKISGFRTKNWNGDLFSPGFVYDNVQIDDWKKFGNYLPGSVVRYNGSYFSSIEKIVGDEFFDFNKWIKLPEKPVAELLPNFDYKINQFEDFYSLDIDNFDYGQQILAQHLIGYTPRTYLNNIFTNPISQYKFYQGFIKDKGTKSSIDKLSKASRFSKLGTLTFNEEWAFRVGHYGGYNSYSELEFNLQEGSYLENPYLIKFVDKIPNDLNPLTNYVTTSSLVLSPQDLNPASVFETVVSTYDDDNLELTTAGYVRLNDVTATAYNKNSLLDIANNSAIRNGDSIWLGFSENGSWTVYRYTKQTAKISGVFVSAPNESITFVTDKHHNLKIGDIVSIVKFNGQVNGVYIVKDIPQLNYFSVPSTLSTIENEPLLSYGSLFKFEEVRFSSFADLSKYSNIILFDENDKIWIDKGQADKWQVYEKIKNYKLAHEEISTSTNHSEAQQYGKTIFANDRSNVLIISAPNVSNTGTFSIGRIRAYKKIGNTFVKQFEDQLNTEFIQYDSPAALTEFGYALSFDPVQEIYFFGAPSAFSGKGLVKIVENNDVYDEAKTLKVTTSTVANNRFGHSLYSRSLSSSTTLLMVGAPGLSTSTTSSVYTYLVEKIKTTTSTTASVLLTSVINVSNTGSLFGWKIAGAVDKNLVAVGVPGLNGGQVNIYSVTTASTTLLQTINSTATSGNFGHDIAISKTGDFLFVSAPKYRDDYGTRGKVFVYKLGNNGLYNTATWQVINNPVNYEQLDFGEALAINDNDDLIISSVGTNRSEKVRFDTTGETEETFFDGDSTSFVEYKEDSGSVYLFNRLGDYFIFADEIIDRKIEEGSQYGASLALTKNNIFVGAPFETTTTGIDPSRIFVYQKINENKNTLSLLTEQPDVVDLRNIDKIALINNDKEEIVEYLEVIDPVKGKIAAIADQELKYKSAFDPAVYSIGVAYTVNDTETNWLDEHVGELWWDLSTVKYIWYEQSDEVFRKNNWGRLFPGATIDVYEWVKSDLLPSSWAAQADTTDGFTKGISGQPKYPDNSAISVKQIYNNVTNSFENVYYFWVKNKVTLPATKNRRISALQVSQLIADPVAQGIKFVEILSKDSVALANIQPLLIDNKININFAFNNQIKVPKHTEWTLLDEGSSKKMPPALLEKKLIDSLLGHDILGNVVPDPSLTYRNRYGIEIRPRQTMFKNRFEAIRNIITFVNSILIKNKIDIGYSFENLNKKEEIPDIVENQYDFIVEEQQFLSDIDTNKLQRAKIECFTSNGKIRSVNVIDPGYGYVYPPTIEIYKQVNENEILDTSGALISTKIDNFGRITDVEIINSGYGFEQDSPKATVRSHTAIVKVNSEYRNKWTKHIYDYDKNIWIRIQNQKFNTPLFWNFVDWQSDTFNEFLNVRFVVPDTYGLAQLSNVELGQYVKVKNNGLGKYIILEKVQSNGTFSEFYNLVYSEKGTIQFSDKLWNLSVYKYAYDRATLDETLYDEIPDLELYYILQALKNDIFIGNLKNYWNSLFFAAVKYALTEQKLLDWAFKTSFINVNVDVGTLDQRPVYKLDNEKYFEDYVKEIKPYRTTIRNYISNYTSLEDGSVYMTDFDSPSFYNTALNTFTTVSLTNSLSTSYPWKSWSSNYQYEIDNEVYTESKAYTYEVSEILVGEKGKGYTQRPTVVITTASGDMGTGASAEAYIKNGSLFKVLVINSGTGYVTPPIVTITGGGPNVTSTATVSVVMKNDRVRKNKISLRFDRTSADSELGNETVTEKFVCPGDKVEFELTWYADLDKANIIPLLDGKLILSNDYRIEQFTREIGSYTKKYSKFVFIKTIPTVGQTFKVTYKKNIDLYNALDRIEKMYNPTETMIGKDYTQLVDGLEYPKTSIQGLKFSDTPPWGTTSYDTAPWDNLTNDFVQIKLVRDADRYDSQLYVNTTTGITVGQAITILNTTSGDLLRNKFRPDTFVRTIDPLNKIVGITRPEYKTKKAKATGLAPGSKIRFTTTQSFYGSFRQGDTIQVNGFGSQGFSGFDGTYLITTCSNNVIIVTASSVLSHLTATISTPADIYAWCINEKISSTATLLDTVVYSTTGTSTRVVQTFAPYKDTVTATVFVNSGTTESIWNSWTITSSTNTVARTNIVINNLWTDTLVSATVKVYGNTLIEFYKHNDSYNSLDSEISGGTWAGDNLINALGIEPEDLIIDGDTFLNPNSSHAPEEFLPGHVADSLGINVYTRPSETAPLIVSGSFIAPAGQVTTVTVSLPSDMPSIVMVYDDDQIFSRSDSIYFNQGPQSNNQFFLWGNQITVPAQPYTKRIGYSFVTAGADGTVDAQYTAAEVDDYFANLPLAVVSSNLLSFADVKSYYVTVNGTSIPQITTSTQYGFMVGPLSKTNKRAAVFVYGLAFQRKKYNIEAFFFTKRYASFNKLNQETFNVESTATSKFTLTSPPLALQPREAQMIVDYGSYDNKKRLLPPSISYYKVQQGQSTFQIDNKKHKPNVFNIGNVKVYRNGYELKPGFEFTVNSVDETVTITTPLLQVGDVIAVMGLDDYDYVLINNDLHLTNAITSSTLRVLSFTTHDNMGLRTERFEVGSSRTFTLGLPAIGLDFIWVSVQDRMLVSGYEFTLRPDLRTIEINGDVEINPSDEILITTINPPNYGKDVLGYRIFKDIFEKQHFKRISRYHSTKLASPLSVDDTSIQVYDGSMLFHPNPGTNTPGVIILDGERIEYFVKNGNELTQLRRSTLGTGPALISNVETQVLDQSARQNIPTICYDLIQHIPSNTTNTYLISTLTNTSSFSISTTTHAGNGITLLTGLDAPAGIDQVEVYFGGRKLRKTELKYHFKERSYDTDDFVFFDGQTTSSYEILPAEFTVDTNTQQITLNIDEDITTGTRITVVQRKGELWAVTSQSLTVSNIQQAVFLRSRPADLPDSYYYGGENEIIIETGETLEDDSGDPLEGF